MTKYLIGGAVVFNDDLFEMARADDPEEIVQLGAASSRCLQVLLEADGEIVTKGDLLHKGWERYKSIVTGNSINQAIAQIRKGFVQLRMSPQSIVTIPRIGYKLSDDLAIEKMDGRKSPVELLPDLPFFDEAQASITGEASDGITNFPSKRSSKIFAPRWLIAALVINLLLALGAWVFLRGDFLQVASRIAYIPVKQIGAVNYFAVEGMEANLTQVESAIGMLQRRPPASVSIESHKYVYINGARRENVHSYFLCQSKIEMPKGRCVSYLILLNEGAR